jgi:hypothetical protein
MKEQNAFDILLEYPKENKLAFETHSSQDKFILFPDDPFLKSKYVIFKKDNFFFYAYDSYAAKAYMTKTFTGIYSLTSLQNDIRCRVTKRDWLDIFVIKDKKRTGIKYIDSNLTIISNNKEFRINLINEEITAQFLKLSETIFPITILIQDDYLPNISELAGKKVIGIETNRWIFKKEEIDVLLGIGGQIINNIINASGQQAV